MGLGWGWGWVGVGVRVRVRSAAAAEHVDKPGIEEELDRFRKALGRLVVATHRVGQASVRVRVHEALGHVRERLGVGKGVG